MKRVISILLSCVILLQCTLLYASCNDDVEYQSEIDAQFELINIRETTDAEVVRYGVDVSEHQGTIDWQAVAASGIEFAFIRVGYRTYGSGLLQEDSYYYENLVGALDAGLQVGVYIYTQAINESEAVEEAEFALDLIQGFEVTLPVIIDFEFAETASGYTIGRLYEADLSIEAQTDICNAFCNTVEAAGYSSGVYASRSVLEDELDTGVRMLLNFGHTLGHAYELAGGYEEWTHGQAVAAGMCRAAEIGTKLGRTPGDIPQRIIRAVQLFDLPDRIDCDSEFYRKAIGMDKKNAGNRISLILLNNLGEAEAVSLERETALELIDAAVKG